MNRSTKEGVVAILEIIGHLHMLGSVEDLVLSKAATGDSDWFRHSLCKRAVELAAIAEKLADLLDGGQTEHD